MKKSTRVLSIVLAFIMLIGIVPASVLSASAEETTYTVTTDFGVFGAVATAEKDQYEESETVNVTIKTFDGFKLTGAKATYFDGEEDKEIVLDINEKNISFTMPAYNVTLTTTSQVKPIKNVFGNRISKEITTLSNIFGVSPYVVEKNLLDLISLNEIVPVVISKEFSLPIPFSANMIALFAQLVSAKTLESRNVSNIMVELSTNTKTNPALANEFLTELVTYFVPCFMMIEQAIIANFDSDFTKCILNSDVIQKACSKLIEAIQTKNQMTIITTVISLYPSVIEELKKASGVKSIEAKKVEKIGYEEPLKPLLDLLKAEKADKEQGTVKYNTDTIKNYVSFILEDSGITVDDETLDSYISDVITNKFASDKSGYASLQTDAEKKEYVIKALIYDAMTTYYCSYDFFYNAYPSALPSYIFFIAQKTIDLKDLLRDGEVTVPNKYASIISYSEEINEEVTTIIEKLKLNLTNYNIYGAFVTKKIADASTDTNGKVDVQENASIGDTIVIDITPNPGYSVKSIKVYKTSDSTPVETNENTFVMPNYDVSIKVTYTPDFESLRKDTIAELNQFRKEHSGLIARRKIRIAINEIKELKYDQSKTLEENMSKITAMKNSIVKEITNRDEYIKACPFLRSCQWFWDIVDNGFRTIFGLELESI